ncbi:MAG: glycosyltransferase family 4 protein [Actinobacteria bacterium]|nr:glycosyltransferase family 4 protein [Actinomycetota bacterium]
MKVGLVCPYDWSAPGGVKQHVRDLAYALMDEGHEVSVLAPAEDDSDLEPFVVSAGRPIAVPYNGSVARVNFGVVSAARVRRWVRDGEFDVVHVHEPASPSLSVLTCWVCDGPLVATWHSSQERSRAMGAFYYVLQTAIEKVTGRIAVSEKARKTLVEILGGDAVLIPNGVSCKQFEFGEPLDGYPRPGKTLLFLGRIDESRKGLAVLLAALPAVLEAFPDLELLVAGPGDIDGVRDSLPSSVAEHVRFLGLISEEDKVRAFKSADVYVAPNTGGESFGIVLLEAMASGTPVVASDIDAFSQVLESGEAGALFANESASSLATNLIELLGDDDRLAQLRLEGYRRAHEFDWASVARDVVRVYEAVIQPGVKVGADFSGQFFGRMG